MIVASLCVAALLQGGVPASDSTATAEPLSAIRGATSAPAGSAGDTVWYRREPSVDARLMPRWERAAWRDTIPRRKRAVEYSDWYYRRLQVHRWGSWLELPVFATEYWLGQKLVSDRAVGDWVKPTHVAVAGVLGGLFTINTVTGLWNLYESRQDTDQRALVWTHSALMLAADAGFAITPLLAEDAREQEGGGNHRTMAVTSMGLATVGTLLMWVKRGM
jgi:hypothetical protein